jgi:hypothetical protein
MMNQAAAVLEEKFTFLLQPDILLPAQYLETFSRKTHLEPERRLMLAVLEDAILCFQDNVSARSGRKKKLFDEAEEWILETNSDWIFSFESICEVLGFNSQYIRQGLLRWKENKLLKYPNSKPLERRKIRHRVTNGQVRLRAAIRN